MKNNFFIKNLIHEKDGLLRGPFGGDLKKEIFVPKAENTYKVYEQGVVLNSNKTLGKYYISEHDYITKLKKFSVRDGDFLVSCSGVNMGAIYQLKEPFEPGIINQALLRIRLNEDLIDEKYFFFLFKELISKKITAGSADSTIPNFPGLNVIKDIEISLPEKLEQKKIGNFLTLIDEKLRLNKKANAILNALSEHIFNYWFLQFDFPDIAGNPYKASLGRMAYHKELKRDIPVNWEVVNLSDIADITMGQSPPGDSYNEVGDGVVFFQGSTDFGERYPVIRQFTTSPSRRAREGDILLSVRAPVGTMNIAKVDCCIGRGLAAIRSKQGFDTYLMGVLQNLKKSFDVRNSGGTTFGSITKDDLFSLKVVRPDLETLNRFHELTGPIFSKQNALESENQELIKLRAFITPMLLSGQISIQ